MWWDQLTRLERKIEAMSDALSGLTTAISALQTQQTANQATFDALAAAATQVDNDVTALIAEINQGAPASEIAADLASIQTITSAQAAGATALANVTSGLSAADQAAQGATPPAPAVKGA